MFDNYKPRARARQLQLDKNNLNVDSIFQNSSLLTINNPKVRNIKQINLNKFFESRLGSRILINNTLGLKMTDYLKVLLEGWIVVPWLPGLAFFNSCLLLVK